MTAKPLLGCRQLEGWHPWVGSSTQVTSGLGKAGKRNFSPWFSCLDMPRRSSVLMLMQSDHWMQSWHWDFCCYSQCNSPVQVQPEAGGVVYCRALVSAFPECRMPRQATSSLLGNFSRMVCGSYDKGFACEDLLLMPCLMGFFLQAIAEKAFLDSLLSYSFCRLWGKILYQKN